MAKKRGKSRRTVRAALCLRKDDESGDLQLAKFYPIVADKAAAAEKLIRVIDDSGEDYLYPASFFVQRRLPVDWARMMGFPA